VSAAADSLTDDLANVVSGLRTSSATRLSARLSGPIPTRAAAGRLLARTLAVAAQGIEDADLRMPPSWRTVPVLADLAVGDQVAVLAHDLITALSAPPDRVWTPHGLVALSELVRDVAATVAEVKRLL
jgi:hypothetical protein